MSRLWPPEISVIERESLFVCRSLTRWVFSVVLLLCAGALHIYSSQRSRRLWGDVSKQQWVPFFFFSIESWTFSTWSSLEEKIRITHHSVLLSEQEGTHEHFSLLSTLTVVKNDQILSSDFPRQIIIRYNRMYGGRGLTDISFLTYFFFYFSVWRLWNVVHVLFFFGFIYGLYSVWVWCLVCPNFPVFLF